MNRENCLNLVSQVVQLRILATNDQNEDAKRRRQISSITFSYASIFYFYFYVMNAVGIKGFSTLSLKQI